MKDTILSVIVLAAGKGTRMKSSRAKVLHELFFRPMIHHVMGAVASLPAGRRVVVTGHQGAEVEKALAGYDVDVVEQKEQLGTGHAVRCAENLLKQIGGTVMILCGDTPLIREKTLLQMLELHRRQNSQITVMTTRLDNPTNYGRIYADATGRVLKIIEEKDATEAERCINEINAGIYCVEVGFLCKALGTLTNDNRQQEYYLTDIVERANLDGLMVQKFVCPDSMEVLGVNSRQELALAHGELRNRRNRGLMADGITILQPESVCVADSVRLANDICITSSVEITGETTVGTGTVINPFVVINDCQIGRNVVIESFSKLDKQVIADNQMGKEHS